MTTDQRPRHYWADVSDEQLIAARDEYLTYEDTSLHEIAANIDDDLARRAAERERMGR